MNETLNMIGTFRFMACACAGRRGCPALGHILGVAMVRDIIYCISAAHRLGLPSGARGFAYSLRQRTRSYVRRFLGMLLLPQLILVSWSTAHVFLLVNIPSLSCASLADLGSS